MIKVFLASQSSYQLGIILFLKITLTLFAKFSCNKKKILQIMLALFLGIILFQAGNYFGSLEKPLSLSTLTTMSGSITGNVVAPEKTLNPGDIEVYPNKIIIN